MPLREKHNHRFIHMDEQYEKMTWTWMDDRREGDVGVNRYYLPNLPTPDGMVRYHHRGASPPPPPPQAPASAFASASASRYLCKRKQVRTRYGRSPDRTSLGVFSPPPPPRLRHRLSIKSARSHSKNDQPIEPPRPHHITADPIRSIEEAAARWVGFPSHPDTHAGAGTGPGRRIVAFSRGGIPNSVLGFGFSTGFMVWVGR